jgi:hypothetical protein
MAVALRIARLHTTLQPPGEAEADDLEAAWLRDLSQRGLPEALAGVAERALARAGLPPQAVVAVRRLDLRLRMQAGASDDALLRAWSQALETALVASLRTAEGTNAVVFVDAWAAEASHLSRLVQGLEPAWWADRLRDGLGVRLDLGAEAVLRRWLERHPARAAAAMAALVERAGASATPACLAALLPEASAADLASALASSLSHRPGGAAALPEPGTPLRALLEATLQRLEAHRGLAVLQGKAALPWRLAVLLHQQPSLALLPAASLLALVAGLDRRSGLERQRAGNGEAASALQAPPPAPEQPTSQAPRHHHAAALAADHTAALASGRAAIHAGGLLLLLQQPELRDARDDWSTSCGDVALLALHRLLAPLGPGEQAAALERERPLLGILCPDRPWPEPLLAAEPRDPQAAAERLAALIAAIPADVAFAPGALRQVYGPLHGATPPLPDRAGHALAALLWRPGVLVWDGWQIRLHWPLASADAALRRAGWDLDPDWQPALRRVVRFVYGSEAGGDASAGGAP